MSEHLLLDPSDVVEHLRRRGLLHPDELATAQPLGGGVSSVVAGITRSGGAPWVTKQALPTLRVAGEWTADPHRALAEAAALRWYASVTPDHVPPLIDVDTDLLLVVIAHAPAGWRDWREELRAGKPPALGLGEVLGRILGSWHRESAADPQLARRWQRPADLRDLRTDPYFRRLDPVVPEALRVALAEVAADLERPGTALVHGDFSPKNMLVGADPGEVWVIDAEVTHWGDPLFDVAFLLGHLALQSLETPHQAPVLRRTAETFLESWQAVTDVDEPTRLLRYTGALLLARVHGRSPQTTLTADQRQTAARVGAILLTGHRGWTDSWPALWSAAPPGRGEP